jgi:hypothetical protein
MSADQPISPYAKFASASRPVGAHPDPEDLVLYAMQFLVGEEAAVITQHLEHCTECGRELARINGDLAAAALTVELTSPPAAARQRLTTQVAQEKKIVPIVQIQDYAPAQAQPQPIATFGRSASVFSIEESAPRRSAAPAVLAAIGWAVAAALAVAVTFLFRDRQNLRETLISQTSLLQRLTADADQAHRIMDALTDPKATRVSLTTKPQPHIGPIAGVTYNPEKGTLVFLASNLDPLQTYKTYELWVIPSDGGAPIPAGTFHPDEQGNASVIMPDLPRGIPAKAFGVTIEADGGSQTPTLPIIMAGS